MRDDPASQFAKHAGLDFEALEPIRVIVIAGIERQADSATHVHSTGEGGRTG